MFTGIVEEIGHIGNIVKGNLTTRLMINCTNILDDAKIGDSIAVNGICLTVVEQGKGFFWVDVMPETMRMTALYNLHVSNPVNLERALKYSGRFGGHIMSGHIDGVGILTDKTTEGNAIWLTIKPKDGLLKYIIMKGSVALDGISLTVAYTDDKSFKVSLIPHTASITTLGAKRIGDAVNIEYDVIAKYVEKLLIHSDNEAKPGQGISENFLKENGFV